MGDAKISTRLDATKALATMQHRAALPILTILAGQPDELDERGVALLKETALEGLCPIVEPDDRDSIACLGAGLGERPLWEIVAALERVARGGSQQAIVFLATNLAETGSELCAQSLRYLGLAAVAPLKKALFEVPYKGRMPLHLDVGDPDRRNVPIDTLIAIAEVHGLNDIPSFFAECILAEDARIRRSGCYGLGYCGSNADLRAVKSLLKRETYRTVRVEAIWALRRSTSLPKGLQKPRKFRNDNHEYKAYVLTLGEIGDEKSVQLLLRLLKHETNASDQAFHMNGIGWVCRALARTGDDRARAALDSLASEYPAPTHLAGAYHGWSCPAIVDAFAQMTWDQIDDKGESVVADLASQSRLGNDVALRTLVDLLFLGGKWSQFVQAEMLSPTNPVSIGPAAAQLVRERMESIESDSTDRGEERAIALLGVLPDHDSIGWLAERVRNGRDQDLNSGIVRTPTVAYLEKNLAALGAMGSSEAKKDLTEALEHPRGWHAYYYREAIKEAVVALANLDVEDVTNSMIRSAAYWEGTGYTRSDDPSIGQILVQVLFDKGGVDAWRALSLLAGMLPVLTLDGDDTSELADIDPSAFWGIGGEALMALGLTPWRGMLPTLTLTTLRGFAGYGHRHNIQAIDSLSLMLPLDMAIKELQALRDKAAHSVLNGEIKDSVYAEAYSNHLDFRRGQIELLGERTHDRLPDLLRRADNRWFAHRIIRHLRTLPSGAVDPLELVSALDVTSRRELDTFAKVDLLKLLGETDRPEAVVPISRFLAGNMFGTSRIVPKAALAALRAIADDAAIPHLEKLLRTSSDPYILKYASFTIYWHLIGEEGRRELQGRE